MKIGWFGVDLPRTAKWPKMHGFFTVLIWAQCENSSGSKERENRANKKKKGDPGYLLVRSSPVYYIHRTKPTFVFRGINSIQFLLFIGLGKDALFWKNSNLEARIFDENVDRKSAWKYDYQEGDYRGLKTCFRTFSMPFRKSDTSGLAHDLAHVSQKMRLRVPNGVCN